MIAHPFANLREIKFAQTFDHNALIQTYVSQQAAKIGRELVIVLGFAASKAC